MQSLGVYFVRSQDRHFYGSSIPGRVLTLWSYAGELPAPRYIFDEDRGTPATNVRCSCGPEHLQYLVEVLRALTTLALSFAAIAP